MYHITCLLYAPYVAKLFKILKIRIWPHIADIRYDFHCYVENGYD